MHQNEMLFQPSTVWCHVEFNHQFNQAFGVEAVRAEAVGQYIEVIRRYDNSTSNVRGLTLALWRPLAKSRLPTLLCCIVRRCVGARCRSAGKLSL